MCIVLCFLAGTGGYAQDQQQQAYINTSVENLLRSPGGARVGQLSGNTRVVILGSEGEWIRIATTGWVRKSALTEIDPGEQKVYIQASHILVRTETEAEEILAKLQAGDDFAKLARQYSIDEASKENGGDLGVFAKGDFMAAFDEAAFKLNPGETSGIVKSQIGYHIIKRTR